jgi:hypothetical protein
MSVLAVTDVLSEILREVTRKMRELSGRLLWTADIAEAVFIRPAVS